MCVYELQRCWYPFSWRILYKPNSIEPNLIMGQIHVLYYFLFFKHGPSPCNIWAKLRKYGLESMGQFLSDLLHEPSPCMLPIEQGTLVAPLAHGEGFVPKISTLKEPLCSDWLWPNFFALPFFGLKHITDPKWLVLPTATTKYRFQGLAISRKYQLMNLGHHISQIMPKASQPSYLIKANLTITSLIETLGFKASSIDSHLEYPRLNIKGPNQIQNEPTMFSPTKLKLETKSPFSKPTLSQFWSLGVEIWLQRNLPSFSHSLSQFPLLIDCGLKFWTCVLFLHFFVF